MTIIYNYNNGICFTGYIEILAEKDKDWKIILKVMKETINNEN